MQGGLGLAAMGLAAVLAACGPAGKADGEAPFAAWQATNLADGSPWRLDPGEGAVVINVWATWCEPCRREMASLERAHRGLAATGIRVVGLNVDEDVLLAREFVRRQGLTFPNVSDPAQSLAKERLGVKHLPTTLAVGRDGRVRWREEAARDWSGPGELARIERTLGPGSP